MHESDPPFLSLGIDQALAAVGSSPQGLSAAEAAERLATRPARARPKHTASAARLLLGQFKSPITLILMFAALLSYFVHDRVDAVIILTIIVASALLGFWQEFGAANAIGKLLSLVAVTTTVPRDGREQAVTVDEIVAGDIVRLAAGATIPADCLVVESRDLFVNEAALTGETYPVEKQQDVLPADTALAKRTNTLFLGTHVVSGAATALAVHVGQEAEFGKISARLQLRAPETDFERGVRRFGYFLVEVTLLLVVAIFAINVFFHKPVLEAFLFSLALAVGLTPQLLPAIISVNLSHGAKRMAACDVIVRRLASIENFGSMNVLCSDKTGTITQGVVRIHQAVDGRGRTSDQVMRYAYLNASFESGFANPSDEIQSHYKALGELGYRTLGVAYRRMNGCQTVGRDAEQDMVFVGFLVLEDPSKERIAATIDELAELGIALKMITGDNRRVAASVAKQVGMSHARLLTGADLRSMSDDALMHRVNDTEVFAEIEPNQKERIILACRKAGNVVGYLGDGINDATALHAADVGISVDQAVDVAKEAADIVLLKQELEVLVEGVREGRRTFVNTMKYVFMATSANFGNMFSMAGASLFLQFLPLLPKQILLMNLLTDLPEMTIARDNVDEELVGRPQRWDIRFIRNFMLVFGTLSSAFDFLTFGVLLLVFRANVPQFRTGWFVESVVSATLVVLIVRTRRLLLRSWPSRLLSLATVLIIVATVSLPWLPLSGVLGFAPLPGSLLAAVAAIVLAYVASAELAKALFYRRSASARHARRTGKSAPSTNRWLSGS
jgi:Mg2+-importing ATPase